MPIECSAEYLLTVIHNYEPRSKYYAKTINRQGEMIYTAVDNSTGDAWTEDFKTRQEAIDWLKGKDYEF